MEINKNQMVSKREVRKVLERLLQGATCDYQPVRGGIIILDYESQSYEGLSLDIFNQLRDQELIEKQRELNNWHSIFRPSFNNPVEVYEITDKGKKYLVERKTKNYFDRTCESHDEFEKIKTELEKQGFKYVGNSSKSQMLYDQEIHMGEDRDIRLAQAREQEDFTNEVEERTWDFENRGYEVVRTQGFKVDKPPRDDLVAFFVKEPKK